MNQKGNIFIVHGHDENLLEEIKAVLEKAKYEPFVLKEADKVGLQIILPLYHFSKRFLSKFEVEIGQQALKNAKENDFFAIFRQRCPWDQLR